MGLFDENRHRVTLDAAAGFTRSFRDKADTRVIGGAFSRAIVDEILAQPGCAALRYYFANDPDGQPTLVLVGVTADNTDLAEGVIAEVTWPCPPFCSAPNPLNSNAPSA